MNRHQKSAIWQQLLKIDDVPTLQGMARDQFSNRLVVKDGKTYFSQNAAEYGSEEFDDLYRLRDWLYCKQTEPQP